MDAYLRAVAFRRARMALSSDSHLVATICILGLKRRSAYHDLRECSALNGRANRIGSRDCAECVPGICITLMEYRRPA